MNYNLENIQHEKLYAENCLYYEIVYEKVASLCQFFA